VSSCVGALGEDPSVVTRVFPYCPYSPECVEGPFPEVHFQDYA
jgi:hypothetical protein